MTKQKTMKAWAVISEEYEIPIADCGEVEKEDIIFTPWAIFSTKKQAMEVKKSQKKYGREIKVVPIEIKIIKEL